MDGRVLLSLSMGRAVCRAVCAIYTQNFQKALASAIFRWRERGQIFPVPSRRRRQGPAGGGRGAWLAQVAAEIPKNDQEAGIAGLRVLRDLY